MIEPTYRRIELNNKEYLMDEYNDLYLLCAQCMLWKDEERVHTCYVCGEQFCSRCMKYDDPEYICSDECMESFEIIEKQKKGKTNDHV